MEIKKGETQRGFEFHEFEDSKGVKCSIQKSSIATEDAIWFGCDDADPRIFIPYDKEPWQKLEKPAHAQSWVFNTRMHLNREQVKQLLPILTKFVADGEI